MKSPLPSLLPPVLNDNNQTARPERVLAAARLWQRIQQPVDEQWVWKISLVFGLSLYFWKGKIIVIVGLKHSVNVPLVHNPEGIYCTSRCSKRLCYQNQTEQLLLSMMRTNLLPPLQAHSLSEMKGKLCHCNSSKWLIPTDFHKAKIIDLCYNSLCLPLFHNLSLSLPFHKPL